MYTEYRGFNFCLSHQGQIVFILIFLFSGIEKV